MLVNKIGVWDLSIGETSLSLRRRRIDVLYDICWENLFFFILCRNIHMYSL